MMKVMIDGKNYWKDANGALKPDELVKPIDKERDELVRSFVALPKNIAWR